MSELRVLCIPPSCIGLALAVTAPMLAKGMIAAHETSAYAWLEDAVMGRRQLWVVVLSKPMAAFLTEIIEEGGQRFVSVFGLGGDKLRIWARPLADRMAEFAKAEGCAGVRFAGRPAWARVLPEFRSVGQVSGHLVFERAVS